MKFKALVIMMALSACVFAGEQVTQLAAPSGITKYKPADFSVKYSGEAKNPFWDAALTGQFTAPSGKKVSVEGFFCGDGIYTVRFCPVEAGNYTCSLVFRKDNFEQRFDGSFTASPSDSRGFLRVSKENSFRFVTDDNKPFYPLGIQTCGAEGMPTTLVAGNKTEQVSKEKYFKLHSGGANIFRVQLGAGEKSGCAIDVLSFGKKDEYNLEALKALDELYSVLLKNGFHSITILMQDMSRWGGGSQGFGGIRDIAGYKDLKNKEAAGYVRKYFSYIAARYAAYTDIWEIFNEDDFAPDEWLNEMAGHIKSKDPYSHLMTTNFERPYLDWCDLVTPHEYMYWDECGVDIYLAKELCRFKHYKKPVFYTEFGNQAVYGNMGRNKWRVAVWSSFFNEGGILLWDETNFRHVSGLPARPANAFLGPEERNDFQAFSKFVENIPVTARPICVYCAQESEIRGYGLRADDKIYIYLNHVTSHMHEIKGLDLTVDADPGKWGISWIEPLSGDVLQEEIAECGGKTLKITIPKIRSDLAAVLTKIK